MKQVTLYCDGSSLGNPGAGGWCGILRFREKQKILRGGEPHTTNNRMELLAVVESLKALKEPCIVNLYSDSSYVCNGINEWLKKWQANAFKDVKNPDLWQSYLQVSAPHKVIAHWVKGHAGIADNELCDSLARESAREFLSKGENNA
ncbi:MULTISPECIES: ribonuclease HI [Helicobacter]|uniref:Ribonuclease H n=2 Tax=Helicobacter typhlonius TaxID=76936 RepID=A0A099UCY6_9HELI|nr:MULTISPECIES: ribonuclease HI [Helicobacter]TLD78786.1 ribonuclease HI [Helicobacter typhlonius]TLD90121.1 ribonuclease HI [Helicobacter sp. MIT 03-1616]CUU40777.1 Ribonuclease HI [Helicobacter typhlonius]HCD73468.1 ribonuclease HI [Helicobacter sp.]